MAEKVAGIGGVFLKARDPATLAAWYRDALGVEIAEYDGQFMTQFAPQTAGASGTVWSIFPQTATHFPGTVMLNYLVTDLDAMLAQLRALGADVDGKVDESEYGRFGWVTDPEGNRVELWQPPAGA